MTRATASTILRIQNNRAALRLDLATGHLTPAERHAALEALAASAAYLAELRREAPAKEPIR